MKKFRRIWLVFVILMLAAFVFYRYVEIQKMDSSAPVISMDKSTIKASIQDGDEVLLEGVTAIDKKDGDVTSSMIVENVSKFYGDHLRTITYAAFDSDNHITKMQRELSYTDYTSPRFELTGSLRFRAGETVNIEKIVKASDCLDGDLSNKIKIQCDTTINNRVTGFYKIKYEVSNSAGDTVTLPIEIEIYEPYNHEVELNLDRYLVYYEGEEIDYMSFLESVRSGNLEYSFADGAQQSSETDNSSETVLETEAEDDEAVVTTSERIPRDRITISSEVDTTKPGVYPVYYYYLEETERYTYEAKEVLYVVVE